MSRPHKSCLTDCTDAASWSPLDLFIRDLDEQKGKLPCCQEVTDIQTSVENVLKALLLEQARGRGGGGGCTGCIRTPQQAPKVRILVLKVQHLECSRLN